MTRTPYTAPWARVIRLDAQTLIAASPTLEVKGEEVDNPEDVWTQHQEKSLWDYWTD